MKPILSISVLLALGASAFAMDATDAAAVQQAVGNGISAGLAAAPTGNPIAIGLAVLASIIGPLVAIISNHFHSKNVAVVAGVAEQAIQAGQDANVQHGANIQTVAAAAGKSALAGIIPVVEGMIAKAVLGNGTPKPQANDMAPWQHNEGKPGVPRVATQP